MSTTEKQLEDYQSYMRLKNYSRQTITSYLRTIRMLYEFRRDHKVRGRISQEHAKQYLLMRIESGYSWSTINCDYYALRKYYKNIMNARWSIKKIPRPQKERVLPEILSQQEVVKLIEHNRISQCIKVKTNLTGTQHPAETLVVINNDKNCVRRGVCV